MAMIKCPRCELNYIQDTEKVCTVCRREMHGEDERLDTAGICPECGEHPVAPGEELCALCLKEASRQEGLEEETFVEENPVLLTAASAMDEIEIEINDGIADEEFTEMEGELAEEEKPEEDEEALEDTALDDDGGSFDALGDGEEAGIGDDDDIEGDDIEDDTEDELEGDIEGDDD